MKSPLADAIWRAAREAGPHPARGWSLYAAKFMRGRQVTRGGVRWRVEHSVEAMSERLLSFLSVEPITPLRAADERSLRKRGTFDAFSVAAMRIGHRGGWWLSDENIVGRWTDELHSPEQAVAARRTLESFLSPSAKQMPGLATRRGGPVPSGTTGVATRIWDFLAQMNATSEGRQSLAAIGYQSRRKTHGNGRSWLVLQAVWAGPGGLLTAVQLEPGSPIQPAERRRIGRALKRAGLPVSWTVLPGVAVFEAETSLASMSVREAMAQLGGLNLRACLQ